MSLYKNSLILSQPGQHGCNLDIFGENQNSKSVALYPGWDASSAPPVTPRNSVRIHRLSAGI